MRVYFVGGPWDGCVRQMGDHLREVRVPAMDRQDRCAGFDLEDRDFDPAKLTHRDWLYLKAAGGPSWAVFLEERVSHAREF